MADEPRKPQEKDGQVVQRLVSETGIIPEQARELVSVLGHDWPSLLREARFLARKRWPRLAIRFVFVFRM
jgi:hypothetical protein